MRDLGDVGVALDALPLAMHAAQEAVFQHHRETRLARRRGWREAFQAVTAEAHFAGELGRGLIGRCALRPHVRRPQTGNRDERNKASADPHRATCDACPDANILGGADFVRLGHDFPGWADRSQTYTSIMIEKSTAFHPRLTVAAQELFD
jgi:hypothetical protein